MRSAVLLACGAILGAAAVYLANIGDSLPASETAAQSPGVDVTAANGAPLGVAQDVASTPPPPATARLDTRADPVAGAAADAGATADPAGISALARRQAALATLAELGNDEAALARVLATLPPADRIAFRIDALAVRAAQDPAGALRGALALDVDAARRIAVERLAETIARLDPTRALEQAALIDNRELQALYLSSAAGAWAETDARAALAWLASAVPQTLSAAAAASALDAVALADVDALLASVDALPSALQSAARKSAIVALVERDPAAALDAVDAAPPSRSRNELEVALAERYALVDPDAAVAWAKQRQSRTVLRAALVGAAANDYEHAVELLLDALPTESNAGIATALIESPFGDFSRVPDRMLASSDPTVQTRLSQLMSLWPQYDAEAALQWAVTNVDASRAAFLRSVADSAGRYRPELAIAAAESAPAELRDAWITGVAAGLADADPERALAFLERHRDEPSYDNGLANVVGAILPLDPRRSAQLVEQAGPDSAVRNRAITVAFQWAQLNLADAAEWAASLDDDPRLQAAAVMNVAAVYADTDPRAALDWVLDLPEGEGRDIGLQLVASNVAALSVALSERALEAIDNEDMRANAAVGAMVAIGREDPDAARRFADKWISDPVRRREAESRIAQQRGGTDGASFLSSMLDVPR